MKRVLVALVFAACGSEVDVDAKVTVTQGLYGQLTMRCEGDGCVGAPMSGTKVGWFDSNPFGPDAGTPMPAQLTTSDGDGVYQFTLDAGSRGYVGLGTGNSWFATSGASIPRGTSRLDWKQSADEGGTWTVVK